VQFSLRAYFSITNCPKAVAESVDVVTGKFVIFFKFWAKIANLHYPLDLQSRINNKIV
jgi:hypothetical protein